MISCLFLSCAQTGYILIGSCAWKYPAFKVGIQSKLGETKVECHCGMRLTSILARVPISDFHIVRQVPTPCVCLPKNRLL